VEESALGRYVLSPSPSFSPNIIASASASASAGVSFAMQSIANFTLSSQQPLLQVYELLPLQLLLSNGSQASLRVLQVCDVALDGLDA
jgi:hypothetical protein